MESCMQFVRAQFTCIQIFFHQGLVRLSDGVHQGGLVVCGFAVRIVRQDALDGLELRAFRIG